MGRHARLGDDAVHRHARHRPDGHRPAAERRPDRRDVRPLPGDRERGAGDHVGHRDARRRAPRRSRSSSTSRPPTPTATTWSYSWDVDGDGTEDADTATVAHTYDEPGTYEAEVTVSDGELSDSADRRGDGHRAAERRARDHVGDGDAVLRHRAADGAARRGRDGRRRGHAHLRVGRGRRRHRGRRHRRPASTPTTSPAPTRPRSRSPTASSATAATVTVTVTEVPNTPPVIASVTATPPSGAAPLAVQVSAAATDADGDKLTYRWDFDGDGQADSSGASAGRVFARPGTYEPEVTVSDGAASVTGSVTITVVPPEPGNRAPSVALAARPGHRRRAAPGRVHGDGQRPGRRRADLRLELRRRRDGPGRDRGAHLRHAGDVHGHRGRDATRTASTDTATVTVTVSGDGGPSGDPPAVTRLTGVGAADDRRLRPQGPEADTALRRGRRRGGRPRPGHREGGAQARPQDARDPGDRLLAGRGGHAPREAVEGRAQGDREGRDAQAEGHAPGRPARRDDAQEDGRLKRR